MWTCDIWQVACKESIYCIYIWSVACTSYFLPLLQVVYSYCYWLMSLRIWQIMEWEGLGLGLGKRLARGYRYLCGRRRNSWWRVVFWEYSMWCSDNLMVFAWKSVNHLLPLFLLAFLSVKDQENLPQGVRMQSPCYALVRTWTNIPRICSSLQ